MRWDDDDDGLSYLVAFDNFYEDKKTEKMVKRYKRTFECCEINIFHGKKKEKKKCNEKWDPLKTLGYSFCLA